MNGKWKQINAYQHRKIMKSNHSCQVQNLPTLFKLAVFQQTVLWKNIGESIKVLRSSAFYHKNAICLSILKIKWKKKIISFNLMVYCIHPFYKVMVNLPKMDMME